MNETIHDKVKALDMQREVERPEPERHQITVDAQDVSDRLCMRFEIGSAEYMGVTVRHSISAGDGSPIFEIGDKTYLISAQELLRAVFHQVYQEEGESEV